MRRTHALTPLLAAAAAVTAMPAAAVDDAVVHATPDVVTVSTFFHGEDLTVTGVAPAGPKLAILLTGERETVELDRKGRVWGFLWMNVGTATLEGVPDAYLLATAGPVCELAPFAVRQRLGMGLDVLGTGGDDERAELFSDLVTLKKRQELYGTFEGALDVTEGGDGWAEFSTVLPLPARISRGTYRVELWGFEGDGGRALAEAPVTVRTVGLTRSIAVLARDHGLAYGFLALFIAVVVGLTTGLVFGLAAKGGH